MAESMDLDSSQPQQHHQPKITELPERKRKHKTHGASSTKKKRKHKSEPGKKPSSSKTKTGTGKGQVPADSPYTQTTATLYLPLSPISISSTHALASLLAEHLSPLLLTYYPPLKGIVLAYSDAKISSTPPTTGPPSSDTSNGLTLATSSGEYGVLYVYLTATFLVFRPQKGQILEGWVNVQSEGFLGAVVLNLFSVGIERRRLPSSWTWVPPGEEGASANAKKEVDDTFDPEKEHFTPLSPVPTTTTNNNSEGATNAAAAGSADAENAEGTFHSASGYPVRGTIRFRVLDIDVIPGTDRERGFMSIEGSMLSPEEEEKVTEEEKNGVLSTATPRVARVGSVGPAADGGVSVADVHVMSGGLGGGDKGEGDTAAETPSKSKSKSKSKKDDKSKGEGEEKKKSKPKKEKEKQ